MTVTAEEFIRRFLMYVLPYKFVKIRHYGILSNRNRVSKFKLNIKLLSFFGSTSESNSIHIPYQKRDDKMSKLTFEELIEEYKRCAIAITYTDYGDKGSVRKSNKAIDKMIKISKRISEEYPSRIYDFAKLLTVNDYRIDAWVAHHILENMSYPLELECTALDVIVKIFKRRFSRGIRQ